MLSFIWLLHAPIAWICAVCWNALCSFQYLSLGNRRNMRIWTVLFLLSKQHCITPTGKAKEDSGAIPINKSSSCMPSQRMHQHLQENGLCSLSTGPILAQNPHISMQFSKRAVGFISLLVILHWKFNWKPVHFDTQNYMKFYNQLNKNRFSLLLKFNTCWFWFQKVYRSPCLKTSWLRFLSLFPSCSISNQGSLFSPASNVGRISFCYPGM